MGKMEELLSVAKLNEIIKKQDKQDKRVNKVLVGLAIVGGIVAIGAAIYAIYRFFAPKYLGDFEDDFDLEDTFDEDFFEDDEIEVVGVEE